jgi:hypothetical protein
MAKPEGELILRGQLTNKNDLNIPWVVSTRTVYANQSINLSRAVIVSDDLRGMNIRTETYQSFSPEQARELGNALLQAADHAEGIEK